MDSIKHIKYPKRIRRFWILILFAITSLLFVLNSYNIFNYQFIGSADYISPISINGNIFTHFFIYFPNQYGGIDVAYFIAHLFPEYLLFYAGNFLHLTSLIISLIYIAIVIFFSEVSMYIYLDYISAYKLKAESTKAKLLAMLFSMLYAFSPAFAALIAPGHFIQAVPYVLFPLLLKQLDLLFLRTASGVWQYFIIYLIFLLSATAFGNVGVVYTILLTLFIYVFLAWIIQKISIKVIVRKMTVVLSLLFLSNVWWVVGFATTLHDLTGATSQDYYINNAINLAVKMASVTNIFLGRPDGQLFLLNSNYYVNSIAFVSFIIIAIFFMLAVIKAIKNRYIVMLTCMTLVGFFLTKGPREPFSNIYMWLYNNVIGFQSFRRPVSKYYGIFIIFYLALSFAGAVIVSKKMSKTKFGLIILLPMLLITGYFIFSFFKSATLIPFNIPQYYYEARNDITHANADKILLLPGTYGIQPMFNMSINNLYTSDFLYYIWDFELVAPDESDSTPNTPIKRKVNDLVKMIRKKKDVCSQLKQLGISHIMVREDLSSQMRMEESISSLLSLLNNNPDIVSKKVYQNNLYRGFTLYIVKDSCRSDLLTVDTYGQKRTPLLRYTIQNPTRINIELTNLSTNTRLYFLNNFSTAWKLYPVKFSNNFIDNKNSNKNSFLREKSFFETDELIYTFRSSVSESDHLAGYEYANEWLINSNQILQNYPSFFTVNKDGSVNMQFVLYYQKQSFVDYGFIIFIISFAVGAVYLATKIKRNLSKRTQ